MTQTVTEQTQKTQTPLATTLWVIDDDPTIRLILEDSFTDNHFKVISFANAHGAWQKLQQHKKHATAAKTATNNELPDIIITDIRMPMMDGLSFSKWLATEFPNIPIIVMTAHADLQSAIDSYQTGAFEYLAKPFDLDTALTIVNKAITRTNHASNKQQSITDNIVSASDSHPTSICADKSEPVDKKNHLVDNSVQQLAPDTDTGEVNLHKPYATEINKSATTRIAKQLEHTVTNAELHRKKHSVKTAGKQKPIKDKPRSHKASNTQITNSKTFGTKIGGSKTRNACMEEMAEHNYGIIGQSSQMQEVFKAIGKLSSFPITVLITGESGTGKELVANALHKSSPRANKPFIALNMSAIPHDLIESELFGHEKGAFTGATSTRKGRFEQADGGTLFLDEIGDMPFNTQTRLLRVLANGEFFRVGGKDAITVDVRIISATHQNLENLIRQGKFREDLFYRLNVIRLPLPPLRERKEDIPSLIDHLLMQVSKELNTDIKTIDTSAMQALMNYNWHGNIRQLENTCRWITVMSSGNTVYLEDLPNDIRAFSIQDTPHLATDLAVNSIQRESNNNHKEVLAFNAANNLQQSIANKNNVCDNDNLLKSSWQNSLRNLIYKQVKTGNINLLDRHLCDFEEVLIDVVLTHTKGHRGEAAHILGWGRNTLTRKINQTKLNDKW